MDDYSPLHASRPLPKAVRRLPTSTGELLREGRRCLLLGSLLDGALLDTFPKNAINGPIAAIAASSKE